MLKRVVLLVGAGFVQLIAQPRDLLVVRADVAFHLAPRLLVVGERLLVGFEALFVGAELGFDFGDVLRQPLDFFGEFVDAPVHELQVAQQGEVTIHAG